MYLFLLTVFRERLKRLSIFRVLVKRNPHKFLTSTSLNVEGGGPSVRNAAVYNNLLLIVTKCSRGDLKALSTSVQITRIKKARNMKSFFPFRFQIKNIKKKEGTR